MQDSRIEKQRLEQLLNKHGCSEYSFNTQSIEDDLHKVNEALKESFTSVRTENLKNIKKYLENLLVKAKKGNVSVNWVLYGNRIEAIPVEIRRFKMHNMQTTDYINIPSGNIAAIDYTDVLNLISLEIVYKDLDMTNAHIETLLKDIGIITIYDYKVIEALVESKTYDKSMIMRIGESSYVMPDRKSACTYFGEKVNINGWYKPIIEESCNTAISIIVQNVLGKLSVLDSSIRIYGIFEDSAYFLLPNGKSEQIENILNTSVVVRTFGRKFEVKPNVQMY